MSSDQSSRMKVTRGLVSVIVTCYNLGEYLEDALKSLKRQTYNQLEVIVLDDESTDNQTIRIFNSLQNKYKGFEFSRLSHRGVEELRNYGIGRSHGEFVFVLDADDIIEKDYISRCVSFLESNKDCSIVTTYVETFGVEKGFWNTGGYDPIKLCTQNVLHVSSVYRKTVYNSVGGYDKQFKGYSDWEFWLHASVIGHKWGNIPVPLFKYRIRNKSMLSEAEEQDGELYSRMVKKHSRFFLKNAFEIQNKFRKELMGTINFYKEEVQRSSSELHKLNKVSVAAKKKTVILKREYQELQRFLTVCNKRYSERIGRIRREKKELSLRLKKTESELWESERVRQTLFSMVESFSRSRYVHIRQAIMQSRSIGSVLLLPLKLTYALTPGIVKNYWRRLKSISYVRPYREKRWNTRKPLVSVIIPVFNYGQFVAEAVKSVENQTFEDYEIIIVEGGSTDGTSPASVAAITGPKIRKYFRKERHYPGSNRDYGISRARGKYILCLDADDKLFPTYLEKTVFIAETMGYDIVGCGIKAFGAKRYTFLNLPTITLEEEIQDNKLIQSSLFRRELYNKCGGYKDWTIPSEAYIAEDWEFWVRMMACGARVYNIQEPLVWYRHHKKSLTTVRLLYSPREHSEKIQSITSKFLTSEAFHRSKRRNSHLYFNVDPLKNIHPTVSSKPNFFSCIPLFMLGGADLVYQQVEKALKSKSVVHIVTDIPVYPERKNIIDEHTSISPRVYEIYKMIPDIYSIRVRIISYLRKCAVKFLLRLHPPSYLYQGGSKLWYSMFRWIKQKFPNSIIVDNQFNPEGHVRDLFRLQKWVDTVIVENQYMKKFMRENLSDRISIETATIGVDTDIFKPRKKAGELFGRKVPADTLVVAFVGRFFPEKGVDTFLECARNMKNNRVLFVLAGYGPLENEIREKLSKDLKSYRKLYMVGCVPDQKVVYAESDVIVVPSWLDGTPNVVKEAMASGLPVIGSKIGGIPEMIPQKEKVGFVCKAGDIKCINKHIVDFEKDRKVLKKYKDNARRYALEQFTKKHFSDSCLEIFANSKANK